MCFANTLKNYILHIFEQITFIFAALLKKTLIFFFLLLQVSVLRAQCVNTDTDTTIAELYPRFILPQAALGPDFPSIKLLKTALAGFEMHFRAHSFKRTDIITLIDFSLPSDKERLWVIDLVKKKVLIHCLVSHGRNSGEVMAEKFSNNPGSCESSPGFYTTGESYIGKHGLSLALDGLETGINDKARERAIVIHGADYVSAEFIKNYGRLGRSLGCPAVPEELSKEIIETIKGGSCLFIYAPHTKYLIFPR